MFSELTKRDVLDILDEAFESGEFYYHGRLDEIDFLSRIFNLDALPSFDSRYPTMTGDIFQHTKMNDDWESNWVFYDQRLNVRGDDAIFIKFIEEVFHPVVIDKNSEWKKYIEAINKVFTFDSVQLADTEQMSGRPVFKIIPLESSRIVKEYGNQIKVKFSSEYIDSQVSIMLENIESNPNVAIGKSKELLESCAKTILDELRVDYDGKLEMMPLMKLVLKELGLSANSQNKETEAGKNASKILGNLASITQNMAELRNSFGDGHGKSKTFVSLPPRYARLAVGTGTTFIYFLWETYQDRKETF